MSKKYNEYPSIIHSKERFILFVRYIMRIIRSKKLKNKYTNDNFLTLSGKELYDNFAVTCPDCYPCFVILKLSTDKGNLHIEMESKTLEELKKEKVFGSNIKHIDRLIEQLEQLEEKEMQCEIIIRSKEDFLRTAKDMVTTHWFRIARYVTPSSDNNISEHELSDHFGLVWPVDYPCLVTFYGIEHESDDYLDDWFELETKVQMLCDLEKQKEDITKWIDEIKS